MAARVVGIRQEGLNPCRMVPSMRDEVHGSCMTSRARSKVHGRALPCEEHELRVAALELRKIIIIKNELIGEQKQASLSGEQDSQVRGERPPVSGHRIPLVRGMG